MESYGVTIQMKATAQYFPVLLFIILYYFPVGNEWYPMIVRRKFNHFVVMN